MCVCVYVCLYVRVRVLILHSLRHILVVLFNMGVLVGSGASVGVVAHYYTIFHAYFLHVPSCQQTALRRVSWRP
jgi:hypothetical protein